MIDDDDDDDDADADDDDDDDDDGCSMIDGTAICIEPLNLWASNIFIVDPCHHCRWTTPFHPSTDRSCTVDLKVVF